MSNYYLIFIWIAIFALLTYATEMDRKEIVYGKNVYRIQPVWAVILVVPLVIWAANRGYVGDTGSYMKVFREMPSQLSELVSYMGTHTKDEGFYFVSAIIKIFITENVKVYFLIVAAIQAFLLFRVYRKYSSRYALRHTSV